MTLPVAMLVQHDADVRTPLASQLRHRGLQIVEASSAAEAYGIAEFGRVDVVIITQTVADREGLELGRRLRASPGTAPLPLVLLRSTMGGAIPSVASAVLPEQCDVDELIAVLTRVVGHEVRR
jgi:CheY-like chemotaxis protein